MFRARTRARAAALLVMVMVAVGLGGAVAGPVSAAEPPQKRDIVLLLDGSGSIDAADWSLQLQGYAAMLSDRVNFPLDGSVGVSVVQWSYVSSSTRTRVEVPLTVLDSPDAVAAVIAQVSAIGQLGSNTNPGDAVRTGTDLLLGSGRADSRWSLCMSTDGAINSGESLAGASSFAQANGVDKFSVVAIQDGSFTAGSAAAAYGPHVFGGGTVTFARTTTEFTSLISGCAADPLRVEAIEVTQSVQDLDNSVPLVAGKPTVVRAYVTSEAGRSVRTSGRLRAFSGGEELDFSPLSPVNASAVLVDDAWGTDREDLDDTLNFRLPIGWTFDSVEFALELPGGVTCDDEGTGTLPCAQDVTFEPGYAADIQFRGFAWGADATREGVTFAEVLEQQERVISMFPIAGWRVGASVIELAKRPGSVSDTNSILASARRLAQASDEQRWYGVIPGTHLKEGGRASGRVASSWLGSEGARNAIGHGRNRGPHELGHTYGLHHTVNAAENGWTKILWVFNSQKKGWCQEVADGSAPDYPFWDTRGTKQEPVLGPVGDARTEIWGMDTRFFPSTENLALSDPGNTAPLMSYCSAQNKSGQFRWIDSTSYAQLLTSDRDPIGRAGDAQPAASDEGLLVRGIVRLDGSPATLQPALLVHDEPTADDPDGTHSVVVLDASGQELSSVRFTPELQHGDPAEGSGSEDVATPDAIVDVVIPVPGEGAARLELRSADGEVLASLDSSAGAPTASIAAPTTGTADRLAVSWQAEDADGDDLMSTLLYSADGGETWQVVGMDLTATEVDLARWTLPASQQAMLRVVVSDGFRSSEATSPQFVLPNLAPELEIVSPAAETVVTGAQAFNLEARAFDAEDGDLDGTSVQWTSDRDGALGSGATVPKRADELSEGTHTITVTVTDSSGAQAAATVELVVRRIAPIDPDPEPAACTVQYVVHGTWDDESTVQVVLRNTGETPWDGWTLRWTLPQGESVGQLWSGDLTTSGREVTVRSLPWNGTVQPGAEVTFGFTGVLDDGVQASIPGAFRTGEGTCG